MQHGAIAENEGQGLGTVALRGIEIELGGRLQNSFADAGGDTAMSVQNAGNGGGADVGSGCNIPQNQLFLGNTCVFHACTPGLVSARRRSSSLLTPEPRTI